MHSNAEGKFLCFALIFTIYFALVGLKYPIRDKTTQTAPTPSILLLKEDKRSSMFQTSVESSDTSSRSGAAAQLIIVG